MKDQLVLMQWSVQKKSLNLNLCGKFRLSDHLFASILLFNSYDVISILEDMLLRDYASYS